MKKLVAITAIICVAATLFVGCGKKDSAPDMSNALDFTAGTKHDQKEFEEIFDPWSDNFCEKENNIVADGKTVFMDINDKEGMDKDDLLYFVIDKCETDVEGGYTVELYFENEADIPQDEIVDAHVEGVFKLRPGTENKADYVLVVTSFSKK